MTKKVALSVAAAAAITAGVGIGIGHFTASSRTRHAEELSRLQQELLDARSRLDRLTQELDEERARAAREGEPRVAVKGQVTAGKKDEVGPEAVGEQSASSDSPIAFGELALSEFSAADWLRIAGDFQRAQSFLLEMQELQRQGKEPEAAFKEGVMREVLKYLQFTFRLMGKLPTTSPQNGEASHPLPQINLKAAMLELSGLPMTIDQKRAVARLGEAYGSDYGQMQAGYADGTLLLEKILDEIELKKDYSDLMQKELSREQRGQVLIDEDYQDTQYDLSSPLGLMSAQLRMVDAIDVEGLRREYTRALNEILKLDESSAASLETAMDYWIQEVSPLLNPQPKSRALNLDTALTAGRAQEKLQSYLLRFTNIDETARERILTNRVFLIPRILQESE